MDYRFRLAAHRGRWIAALTLIGAMVTCVDHPTPTSSSDSGIPGASTATVASAAITQTLLTSGINTVNQRVYPSAVIAPAPNTLITVAVLEHSSLGTPPIPTLSGGGMAAWDVVATVTFDGTVALRRLTIFRALSDAPGSGPITITSTMTLSHCQWIVSQWGEVDVSGGNGAGAIVQTGSTSGVAVSGLAVSLAAFEQANNVAYGAFAVRSQVLAVTPGAGFTEISEQPSGESTPGDLEAEWATNLNPIAATWTNLNAAALGVEIRAAGAAGGGGVSASQSTVTASSSSITAATGTSTITVTAKDASGNPVSGATVVLSATGTGNTVTQPAGPTDAAGVATGTLSSTVVEAKTVSATANGTAITQTVTVNVTPGPVSASQSTVAAAPTSIAPGSETSTITVTAKDANGNPISGAAVVLAATGTGSVLTQPAAPTNSSGVATGTLSSSVEETATVSAMIAGTPITQTATVTVVAQTAAAITHTLLTSGANTVNQRIYTTAAIAPAPNRLITVAVLGHNSSSAPSSPTLSGGGMSAWTEVATITFDTGTLPLRRLTIFRAMSSSPGSGPLTITFNKTESHCQWIVSQWDGVDPSGVNGAGAIVQTGSARGEAVNGLAVTLAPFGNAGNVAYGVFGVRKNVVAVTPGAGFTEIAEQPSGEGTPGDLEAEWATNDNTIDASWSALNGAALGVEIKAGNAGPGSPVVSVDVTPAAPTVVVGGTVQLTAIAKNAEGEPLPGHPFTWATDAPQFATVSAAGLVTGVAAGSATITATTEGKSGAASVTVTANSAPVASVDVTPTSAIIVIGGAVQLTATPRDAAGQPLGGRVITWGTDAPQVATVSTTGLVTGAGMGVATITATSEGKSGASSITVTTGGTAAQVGEFSAVLPAPIVQVHLNLLLDGRVLSFGENGIPQVWDPATGVFTAVPSPSLAFCGGHDFLPDGRLLATGGGTGNGLGLRNTNFFDPVTSAWVVGPNMAQGRWYPTTTTMPNGAVVTIAGQDENGTAEPIPEIWDGTSWRQLTGASLTLPNYPRDFVAPDGRLFVAGPQTGSRWLDVTGAGSWTTGPSMKFGGRAYGAAVMYEPGKILYVGGNSTPTNTAEIIDLNLPNPQWAFTGSLAFARWNLNATVLPTGEVLATGGVSGDRSNPALAVYAAELWSPATGSWTTMASAAQLLRGYHSSALLLPDGRVIYSGGGDGASTPNNHNYELYSPPYLFKGARPTVSGATPADVAYGQSFTVGTAQAASITKVTLIRFGAVTHAFNQGQRLVPLSFSQVSGGISVTLPSSRTVAPPGPYMLFLVNGNGVPSVARIMRLQ